MRAIISQGLLAAWLTNTKEALSVQALDLLLDKWELKQFCDPDQK